MIYEFCIRTDPGLARENNEDSVALDEPTRLGILADIHANSRALEAVLDDAARRGIRQFVDLGDVLYGPLEPRRTYDLLKTVDIVAQVSGNQDRLIRDASADGRSKTLDFVLDDLGWLPSGNRTICSEPIEWLRTLPQTAVVDGAILLCHGSPSSDTTYLLEDVSSGRPLVRPESAILEELGDAVSWPVILCGHTHVPRLVQLRDGPLILNPGSVGLPAYDDEAPAPHFMETFSPHACYAVLEKSSKGWTAAFYRIPYDWHAAAARARQLNRPDWAQGIEFGRME